MAERKRRGRDAVDRRLADLVDETADEHERVDGEEFDQLDSGREAVAVRDDEPAGVGPSKNRRAGRAGRGGATDTRERKSSRAVSADDKGSAGGKGSTVRSRSRFTFRPAARGDGAGARDRKSGPNIVARWVTFIREVVAELRKVIWPSRKELLTYTAVVVVFVTIMFTVVAGLDWAFAKGVVTIFGKSTSK